MTGKEKMLTSMTGGLAGDCPVVVPYIDIFLRDHWHEITDEPWWSFEVNDIEAQLRIAEDLQEKLDLDWVPCDICHSKEWRTVHKVAVRGDRVYLVNKITGNEREVLKEPLGGFQTIVMRYKQPSIKTIQDVDKYVDIENADDLLKQGKLDYIKAVLERFGSNKFVFSSIGTPNEYLSDHFGITGMALNLYKNPKLVEYLVDRFLAHDLELLKAYASVGVHGVFVEECLPLDMISPAHFRRFALPSTKAILSEIRRLGMKSIIYCCGNMRPYFDDILKADPDCISLEESKKGFNNDIKWINEAVAGKCCIFGNLDAIWVLEKGTSMDLDREIRRQIDIGREHGNFVMSLGSPVTALTPTKRVREYVDLTRQIASSS